MTTRFRSLIAAIVAAAVLAPAAASADYYNFGSWSGYGHDNHYNNQYNNRYSNGWNNWGNWGGWRGYGNGFYGQGRDCHPVKEKLRDNYGNRVVIQSIQCYDRHGRAYIVPGSSQILRWH